MAATQDDGATLIEVLVHEFGISAGAAALYLRQREGEEFESFERRVGQILVRAAGDLPDFGFRFFGKCPP